MTQETHPLPGAGFDVDERDREGTVLRRIAGSRLASLWLSEVPKVVQRHEVRRALGLIS
jgi:hypothetical protein